MKIQRSAANPAVRGAALALVISCLPLAGRAADAVPASTADHGIDSIMNLDPALPPIPAVASAQPKLKQLWMEALARPEPGLRFQTLEALAAAAEMHWPAVNDFLPAALKLLRDSAQPAPIRLAAARVAIDCDAHDAGPDLLALNRAGSIEFALQADPALARWKTPGASDLWLQRLHDPACSQQLCKSAIRSLAAAGVADAVPSLQAILLDPARSSATRVVAAGAIADLGTAAAQNAAADLLKNKELENRLLAALVLPPHAESTPTLLTLAQDNEPAVAAVAVRKLLSASPVALYPLAAKLAAHPDASVRQNIVEVLQRRAAPEDVPTLTALLDDPVPDVRAAARESLIQLDANAALQPVIRQAATVWLNAPDHWRATEQAALLLGSVHDAAATSQCVALLRDPSPDVRLGAIVAIRRLNIPDSFPPQLQRAEELADAFRSLGRGKGAKASPEQIAAADYEIAQLNQNLGVEKYAPADSYLRKFIPKGASLGIQSRYAAIWSLGLLHENAFDASLAHELESRVTDESPTSPEDPGVKVMAAIALARMANKSAQPALKKGSEDGGRVEEACDWAVAKLNHTPYPGPKPTEALHADWFLQPTQ